MKKRFTEEQIIGFLREAEAAMRRAQQYSIHRAVLQPEPHAPVARLCQPGEVREDEGLLDQGVRNTRVSSV